MSLDGATASFIPYTLNGLQDLSVDSSTVSTLQVNSLTPNRVIVSDGSNFLVSAGATSTEVDYLSGTTSNIQNQINTKASTTYVDTNFLNKTTATQQNVVAFCNLTGGVGTTTLGMSNGLQWYKNNAFQHGWNIVRQIGAGSILKDLVFRDTENNVDTLLLSENGQTVYVSLKCDYSTASRIPIFDADKKLVSSGVDSIKITYLDNVSSDIQSQLNGKLNLSGNNANQDIVIGTYKVQSSATPTTGNDYTNKTYIDGQISGLGSVYLPLTGGTLTGTLVMGANKITTSYTPVNAEDITRKGYVDSQDAQKLNLTGGTLTGDLTVNGTTTSVGTRFLGSTDVSSFGNFLIGLRGTGTESERLGIAINGNSTTGLVDFVAIPKTLKLAYIIANRVLVVDGDNNVRASTVSLSTLEYLDIGSSLTGLLNLKSNLAGNNTFTGTNTFTSAVPLNLSGLTSGRALTLDISNNLISSTTTGTELNYLSGTIASVQNQINARASTGAQNTFIQTNTFSNAVPIKLTGLTASRVLILDGSQNVQASTISTTTLGFLDATSSVQAQLNARVLKVGDTMTVSLVLTNTATPLHLNTVGTQQIRFQTSTPDNHYITAANDLFALNANLSLSAIPNVGRGSCQVILQTPTAGGFIQFLTGSAINTVPSERMRISGAGNLGIGTTDPKCSLYNYASGISGWKGQSYFGNENTGVIAGTFNNVAYLGGHNAALNAWTDIFLAPGGNVGIGTISVLAGTKLHVQGNTRIEGTIGVGAEPSGVRFLRVARAITADSDWSSMISFENTAVGAQYTHWEAGANVFSGKSRFTIRGGTKNVNTLLNYFNLESDGRASFLGLLGVSAGNPFAIPNNYMASGSLTIGDVDINYGGGTTLWSTNTAGLMMECLANTEIAIHDGGNRVASFMYFQGDAVNTFTIGRDMGWGLTPLIVAGRLQCNDNVGIGMNNPLSSLDINRGTTRTGTHGTNLGLYITSNAIGNAIAEFRDPNGTQGIGIGYNRIYATGSNTNQDINILPRGTGRVGIRTESPQGDLHVQLAGAVNDFWGKLVVKTTSFWGDGTATRSETAGVQYATVFPMMYMIPHIVSDDEGWCRIRMGRAGGVQTGRWWEVANRVDSFFQIGVEGASQFVINPNGNVGIPANLTAGSFVSSTNVGIGTASLTGVLDVYNTSADYTNSVVIRTPWSSITLDNTQIVGGHKWSVLAGGTGAGVGVGGFGIFDITNSSYRMGIQKTGQIQLGPYLSRARVGIMGGNATGNVSTTSAWPDDANGILISDAAADQTSSTSALFLGHQQNLSTINSLAPNVAWKDLYVLSKDELHYTNGSFNVYLLSGTSGWLTVSDVREKEDIQLLKTDKSLQRVLALKPYHYRRKYYDSATPVEEEIKQKRQIGFLAQDVKESNPHCVNTWCNKEAVKKRDEAKVEINVEEEEVKVEINVEEEEDDGERFSLNYNDYVIHLVGAVQEQQRMINEHQKQIQLLSQRNQILEDHARKLEMDIVEYRDQTDRRMTQLAELVKGLLEEKNLPKLSRQKSVKP
jgi:hypothetical protein